MISRAQFIDLVETARQRSEPAYVRQLLRDWTQAWPGDNSAALLLAEMEIDSGLSGSAIDRLLRVINRSPGLQPAYPLLAAACERSGDALRAATFTACAAALDGEPFEMKQAPAWIERIAAAQRAAMAKDLEAAVLEAQDALLADVSLPLPAYIAFTIFEAAGLSQRALDLAQSAIDRWPDVIEFRLAVAIAELERGRATLGVEHLHRTAQLDPTGETARKRLGEDHPYLHLWPDRLTLASVRPKSIQDISDGQPNAKAADQAADPAFPGAADRSEAGELPQPEPWEAFRGPDPGVIEDEQADDPFQDVREELARLAQRLQGRPKPENEDDRAPTYVILSSRTRLQQLLQPEGFRRVHDGIRALASAVHKRPGWSARVVYIDDPTSLQPFGLKPVDPANAWQIKLRLADLDAALSKRGHMIGALLIVGGPEIIPFHSLPNPTEDEDAEIPSDNPYGTTDENYFAPEWPVGRLPQSDADGLTRSLRSSAEEHTLAMSAGERGGSLRAWLAQHFGKLFGLPAHSIGYTASIWRKASMAVFRTIGEPGTLLTSPPLQAEALPANAQRPAALSYYNLHGLEDAPDWYGQRDPVHDEAGAEEFPIALRIQDVVNSGRAPKIVYTEACFGANIMGKTADSALALRFLDRGSQAVVGSTKISYGSVTPPLIAADLLGRRFWEGINRQLPVGEALRRAKLQLAGEMHDRQGYLDGEDQKALISFVLYGDPLYSPRATAFAAGKKAVSRSQARPQDLHTACSLGGPCLGADSLDAETQARVKSIVSRYLPGMDGASMAVHHQHHGCDSDDHNCPSHQVGIKALPGTMHGAKVVTLSKTIRAGDQRHPHYARVTLDGQGKVLKLAVSR